MYEETEASQLRGSFSQTYGVSLPDQCIVRQLPEDSTVNTLILATPTWMDRKGVIRPPGVGISLGAQRLTQ